jgi:hypothetical protein
LLGYEMASGDLVTTPVYSIRGRSPRPDGKAKTEGYEYAGLPGIEIC